MFLRVLCAFLRDLGVKSISSLHHNRLPPPPFHLNF